jgi:hypothetical protein
MQWLKQKSAILSTDDGIQMDRSDEQFENAWSPRVESFEHDSNATLERVVRDRNRIGKWSDSMKEYKSIEVMNNMQVRLPGEPNEGRQIDSSDEQLSNTDSPIVKRVEPDSIITTEGSRTNRSSSVQLSELMQE